MSKAREEIPRGTLDMLILKAIWTEERLHGFQIAEWIRLTTFGVLLVEEGSLYPALQRMLIKGWIVGEWDRTYDNRRARYYQLTPRGLRQLNQEVESYQRVTAAITQVLFPA